MLAEHYILHAYYVNAAQPTGKTAILVHGYTANSFRMMMLGQIYNENLQIWETLPKQRAMYDGEGFMPYIENQRLFEYTMFIIVYKYLFGVEYHFLINRHSCLVRMMLYTKV